MTVKRDFEMSDLQAEQLLEQGMEEWGSDDRIVIDPDDTELTMDADGVYYVKGWLKIQ